MWSIYADAVNMAPADVRRKQIAPISFSMCLTETYAILFDAEERCNQDDYEAWAIRVHGFGIIPGDTRVQPFIDSGCNGLEPITDNWDEYCYVIHYGKRPNAVEARKIVESVN